MQAKYVNNIYTLFKLYSCTLLKIWLLQYYIWKLPLYIVCLVNQTKAAKRTQATYLETIYLTYDICHTLQCIAGIDGTSHTSEQSEGKSWYVYHLVLTLAIVSHAVFTETHGQFSWFRCWHINNMQYVFRSSDTDNYLLVMVDTDKITDYFPFLYFKKNQSLQLVIQVLLKSLNGVIGSSTFFPIISSWGTMWKENIQQWLIAALSFHEPTPLLTVTIWWPCLHYAGINGLCDNLLSPCRIFSLFSPPSSLPGRSGRDWSCQAFIVSLKACKAQQMFANTSNTVHNTRLFAFRSL